MLSRRSMIATALAAGLALMVPAQAFAASWVTLGSRSVNLIYDHDTIRVGAAAGLYTNIRLKVTGNAVFISDLHVTFSNGSSVDVPVRFMFLPGTWQPLDRSARRGAAYPACRPDIHEACPSAAAALVTLQGYKL